MKIQNVNLSDINPATTTSTTYPSETTATAAQENITNEIATEFHKDYTSPPGNLASTPVKEVKKSVKPAGQQKPFKVWLKEKLTRKNVTIGLISLGFVIIAIMMAYIYFFVVKVAPTPSSILTINSTYITPETLVDPSSAYISVALTVPTEPKTAVSPLNGELFTATDMAKLMTRRPIFVMVDNQSGARPQSNFTNADMVYETLAEAGISRYMAVFWSNNVTEVGPIRSLRQYFLEWLSPYDPILVHDGCATSSDPHVNSCGNYINYHIKQLGWGVYGAWRDNTRYAPHNEYTNPQVVWSAAKDAGWGQFPDNLATLQFKRDADVEARGTQTDVKIKLSKSMNNWGAYDSEWIYDANRNIYLRRVGGVNDIDRVTKTRVYAKTVIIQQVKYVNTYDSKGHVIITTIGEGQAKVLQDGKIYNVTWKKPSRTDITKYYNADGSEFVFNRGLMWIVGLPSSDGQVTIVSQ